MSISGNMVGSYSQIGKTFIIQDQDGNEVTGVVTDSEVIFTAGDNDVREGMVYASDSGVSTGSKHIPKYYAVEGYKVVTSGSVFGLTLSDYDSYDYTKLQCIICPFNTSITNSVAAEKVAIENDVYEVNSITSIATIEKDSNDKTVNLGITNNTSSLYIIRFFIYKEME